jgi:2-phospho-L-lactate guanylyltransferase (CobY/MobA/RfbA family)
MFIFFPLVGSLNAAPRPRRKGGTDSACAARVAIRVQFQTAPFLEHFISIAAYISMFFFFCHVHCAATE